MQIDIGVAKIRHRRTLQALKCLVNRQVAAADLLEQAAHFMHVHTPIVARGRAAVECRAAANIFNVLSGFSEMFAEAGAYSRSNSERPRPWSPQAVILGRMRR